MGFDETDEHVDAIGLDTRGRAPASHRSCRRRAPRREKCAACRASRLPPRRAGRPDRGDDRSFAPAAAMSSLDSRVYSSASSARFNISTFTRGSPKRPERARLDMILDDLPHPPFVQIARPGDGGNLRQRELRRDMRIEARARCRHGVGGDHVDAPGGELRLYRRVDAVDQLFRGRPEIGAGGVGGVIGRVDGLAGVGGVRRAGRRGTRAEIFVAGEILADQRRADNDAAAFDLASIGFIAKGELRDAGDRQRIGEARQQREQNDHDDRRADLAEHDLSP